MDHIWTMRFGKKWASNIVTYEVYSIIQLLWQFVRKKNSILSARCTILVIFDGMTSLDLTNSKNFWNVCVNIFWKRLRFIFLRIEQLWKIRSFNKILMFRFVINNNWQVRGCHPVTHTCLPTYSILWRFWRQTIDFSKTSCIHLTTPYKATNLKSILTRGGGLGYQTFGQ